MKHISYEMAIQFALEDELIFPYDLLTREEVERKKLYDDEDKLWFEDILNDEDARTTNRNLRR